MSSGKRPSSGGPAHRSTEELRRSGLNMERMVKKNVMASRSGGMMRGFAVVEHFKKLQSKEQQEASAPGSSNNGADDVDKRSVKRRKKLLLAEASASVDSNGGPTTIAATVAAASRNSLSPARRSSSGAITAGESLAALMTSPQRQQHFRGNPLHLVSPARARAVAAMNVSSPARPPRAAGSHTMASPSRAVRNGTVASPMRRPGQFLTSPLRAPRTAPSPRKPLFQDDDDIATVSSSTSATTTTTAGVSADTSRPQRPASTAPRLESALDQIELRVNTGKTAATASSVSSKSPFQSFQSKLAPKPRHDSLEVSSPTTEKTIESRDASSEASVVDLTSPPDRKQETATATAAATAASAAAAATQREQTHTEEAREMKPARSLFAKRSAIANRSMCFSTEGVASSLDVSPDGEIVVVGFTDGSVRLYEMDSSVPSDRHGYLLGHIDEESTQGSANVNLRVKITPDGRYIFVGCRTGPRVVMSINLDHYRNEKDDVEDDFEQFQKSFLSGNKVRGFADATKFIAPRGVNAPNRHSYYLLFGLGVGTLRMWQFVEGKSEPEWSYLHAIVSGGNTATVAAFIAPPMLPGEESTHGELSIACIAEDRNLRVWSLAYSENMESKSGEDEEGVKPRDETASAAIGVHVATSHFDVPNTKDLMGIYGSYAYGISYGEAYRLLVPLTAAAASATPRQSFEMEKFDNSGSGKSRRSKTILESAFASDDGRALVAVSTEGVFYYSNALPLDAEATPMLRIIGKNSSLNQQYKTPMKVYIPLAKANGGASTPARAELKSMMAVVCNPGEDEDDREGFFNVDPTEVFASRWLVPSRGQECWVCGVRNTCHWQSPSEQHKARKPGLMGRPAGRSARSGRPTYDVDGDDSESSDRGAARRGGKKRRSKESETPTPRRRAKPKTKKSPTTTTVERAAAWTSDATVSIDKSEAGRSATTTPKARPRLSVTSGGGNSAGDDSDASVEASQSSLAAELAHYKDRLTCIEVEWKRRLKGEIQMRRRWKQRESEFHEALQELLSKLDAAEQQVAALSAAQKDAEKRFSFEKLKAEQQSSVRARYDRLCEQMGGKMALVDDQRRVLEQTTRSLLVEVDRNVQSLKSAVGLERSECVVCKDKVAVSAVVPCGHLCFCEEDGAAYRRNAPGPALLCPICQGDLVSLLRIY